MMLSVKQGEYFNRISNDIPHPQAFYNVLVRPRAGPGWSRLLRSKGAVGAIRLFDVSLWASTPRSELALSLVRECSHR
jgi:hypothetical protein